MNNLWIGMDISKGHMDVTALHDGSGLGYSVAFSGKYNDTIDGHTELARDVRTVLSMVSPSPVVHIGMEATGGYERNWAHWAKEQQRALAPLTTVTVHVLNPLAVKRYLDRDLHRSVTDASSAMGIACYLAGGMRAADAPYTAEMEGAISYYRAIRTMTQRAASMASELEMLLMRTHPELVRYCREGVPNWVLHLLERYPTSAQLARARPETLARIRSVTLERAQMIVAAAANSVASLTDHYAQLCIEALVQELRTARERVEKHRRHIISLMENDTVVRILDSIPGIGVWSAICLRLEIGTIDRFPSFSALVSFVGLDPVVEQSGDGVKRRGISKRGNARIRAMLYLCAMTAERSNPVVAALAGRLDERGKPPKVRLVAGMRKLLGLVYACWLSEKPFDLAHWQRHVARAKAMEERAVRRAEKRMKSPEPSRTATENDDILRAPLSRREVNRRKATAVPQGVLADVNVVLVPPPVVRKRKGELKSR